LARECEECCEADFWINLIAEINRVLASRQNLTVPVKVGWNRHRKTVIVLSVRDWRVSDSGKLAHRPRFRICRSYEFSSVFAVSFPRHRPRYGQQHNAGLYSGINQRDFLDFED